MVVSESSMNLVQMDGIRKCLKSIIEILIRIQ